MGFVGENITSLRVYRWRLTVESLGADWRILCTAKRFFSEVASFPSLFIEFEDLKFWTSVGGDI